MAENIYKKFRGVELIAQRNTISKRFDEPSYLSFRLQFAADMDNIYNYASNPTGGYDTMPHPLFDIRDYDGATNSNGFVGVQKYQREIESYSAYQYLVDANEPTRAAMLLDFINKFNVLQEDFPHYFQSIEGLGELIKTDPVKGQRIANGTKLTITCLEGLDLRISYLLNMYRKIAWDDVYQRWVLPDMMRYFTLKIFISEFRTFHVPQNSTIAKQTAFGDHTMSPRAANTIVSTNTPSRLPEGFNKLNTAGFPVKQQANDPMPEKASGTDVPLYLSILDDVLPTWEITCEMCEFDLTSLSFDYLGEMNVTDTAQAKIKFAVNVGNIKELQIYPSFENSYLSDRKLNGPNRAKDEISTQRDQNNKYAYPASLHIAQVHDGPTDQNYHISGTPYGEFQNDPNIMSVMNQSVKPSQDLSNKILGGANGDEVIYVEPTQPETWTGNAVTWGMAFAKNQVNNITGKAKLTTIPLLGVSFTEIKAAIQSKNIIAALGMVRKGVNEVVNSYGNAPSSLLDQPIQTDDIMKAFLSSLTRSEATDEDSLALQSAADMALNDKGVWEKIKDYSMATDLVGPNEINTVKHLEPAQLQSASYTPMMVQPAISLPAPNAVSGNITSESIITTLPSINLGNSAVSNLNESAAPSEFLGETIQSAGIPSTTPSSQLGNTLQTNEITRGNPSQKLSSTANTVNLETQAPSALLGNDPNINGLQSTSPSNKLNGEITHETLEKSTSNIRTLDSKNILEFDPTSIMYSKATNSKLNT